MKIGRPKKKTTPANSKELAKQIVNACEEAKGQDLVILNVSEVFGLSDYFVIVSGRSDRQSQGISNRILNELKEVGVEPTAIEGYEGGQWILMDYDDVIVHVFYGPTRDYYDLESLWLSAEKITFPASGKGAANKDKAAA
ncbi:MAG: ribosome silencing factor [Bdellovibrionales bacterium]|nr:ribosome silencing factor [Bdellovibrionales bacterium]